MKLNEIGKTNACVHPVLRPYGGLGTGPLGLDSVSQAAEGAEDEPGLADQPVLFLRRYAVDRLIPDRRKEVGEQRQVRGESAQLLHQIVFIAALDAIAAETGKWARVVKMSGTKPD